MSKVFEILGKICAGIGNIINIIEKWYKKIQGILSPMGSYVLASIPFYFLYQFYMSKGNIKDTLLIYILLGLSIVLNIFMSNLAVFPTAILFFLSIQSKDVIFAIAVALLIVVSYGNAKMVKKGKYQIPLLIMILTGCLSDSPVFMIIGIMFMCSIFWGSKLNVLIAPIAVVFNMLLQGSIIPIDTIFNAVYYPKFVIYNPKIPIIEFAKSNWIFYIGIFIGVLIIASMFSSVTKVFMLDRFSFLYILIAHLYAGITFFLVNQIVHLSNALYIIDTINKNGSSDFNMFASFENFKSMFPAIDNYFKNSELINLHIGEVFIALLLTLGVSLFVNGYECQKTMAINKNGVGNNDVIGDYGYMSNMSAWDEIAGYEDTKEEIKQAIAPYTNPIIMAKLQRAHMDPIKGILFYGPPGCGKTMFAKAMASASNMRFISVKGNEFSSKYVGESEKNLREIFETARNSAPAIVFFDEIEAFLQKRESSNGYEKTLVTTFLTEVDGFAKNNSIMIVGATNNPDMLDTAAIRPGRFDKCIYIDTPNEQARTAIINKYLYEKAKLTNEQLKEIVVKTKRYSGADLRAVIEETFRQNKFQTFSYDKLLATLSNYKPTMDYEMHKKFVALQAKYSRSSLSTKDVDIKNHQKFTWDDAPGMDKVKEQIVELVEKPLKYAKRYKELGLPYSKGIIMYGPPGCGKTLVSKIVASEYGMFFRAVNGPELLSKNIGESEERIRKVFMEARDNAPSIIFFDEFDSIAEKRAEGIGGTKVINQLLTEMDGNEGLEGVIVIAATNRIEVIDSALKRPGRFDGILYVGMPNEVSRKYQFDLHLSKLPVKFDTEKFSKLSDKFTCADVEMCCKKIIKKELNYSIDSPDKHVTEDEACHIITSFKRSLTDEEIERYESMSSFERI